MNGRHENRSSIARWCASLVFAAACSAAEGGDGDGTGDDSSGSESGGGSFDEAEVIGRARAYATELVQINAEARPSQHGLASTVNMWVDQGSLEAYAGLDPDTASTTATWSPSALIVKEHLDDAGVVNGLTVMAQGDPASTSGGWWWARLGPADETFETGQVGFCISCHMPVAERGWAFGVPLDNRR